MKINQRKKDDQKSIEAYSPQGGPLSLREAMNRLFDESIWDPFDHFGSLWLSGDERGFVPRVDVSDSEKEVVVTADVPGVNPDKIEIEADEDSLTISGESEREEKEEKKSYYCLEREYGQFRRMISLPARIDPEKVKAKVKDGVLTITLPKTKESKRRQVRVEK